MDATGLVSPLAQSSQPVWLEFTYFPAAQGLI